MRLVFKKVRFKNFMSFGDLWTEISLDQHTTTLVTGLNGSGKSSAILDTISFACFNKPFRNINNPQVCNTISGKDCLVELWFVVNDQEIMVRRGIKPVVFEIYKDGELVTEDSDRRDYQKYFEKYILRINHKTFCQIVMLGSAIFVPFMALPAASRRDVIEDLLDLKIFTKMNVVLKERSGSLEKQIAKVQVDRKIIWNKVELIQEHISKLDQMSDNLIDEKKQLIIKAQTEIKQHRQNIESATEKMQTFTVKSSINLSNDLTKLNNLKAVIDNKRQTLQKEIEFYQHNETCPTCSQSIDVEFKQFTILPKIDELRECDNAFLKLEERIVKAAKDFFDNEETKREMQVIQTRINQFHTFIIYQEDNISRLKREIEKLQVKEDIDFAKLTELEVELAALDTSILEQKDDLHVMDYASTMLKDNGIKSRIIKTYIPIINQLIQKYLAVQDFFVEFTIDETFKEKILSRYRDEFSYESFSEGEKTKLNLAVLFAWRALAKLRGSVDCNLVIFDEILDGNLDTHGTENLWKLIMSLTKDENLFLITHKANVFEDKMSRILNFEKTQNYSKIIEK